MPDSPIPPSPAGMPFLAQHLQASATDHHGRDSS